jgi:DNA-directed RNA polymerase specialized sigma subunit
MKPTSIIERIYKRNLIEKYCFYAEEYLDIEDRLLFLMYFSHGYSGRDIAKLLKISPPTVYRKLDKAIKKLEKNIVRPEKIALEKVGECVKC